MLLVTGGALGLGREVVLQLARKGHDVLIHFHKSVSQAEALVQEAQSLGVRAAKVQADFASQEAISALITALHRDFPDIKGIVHNVGNYSILPLSKMPISEWHTLFQTNFFAALTLTQALLASIIRHKGSIVTLGVSGLHNKGAKEAGYFTTKAALLFYTQSLAKELAPFGVSANMVSPGYMETSVDLKTAHLPMKRPAHIEEVARVITFLFENPYITGQNIEVAGGFAL